MKNLILSRRSFLSHAAAISGAILLAPGLNLAADMPAMNKPGAENSAKPLIVYFSRSGHTRKIAEDIHRKMGGDMVEIIPEQEYPEKYNDLTEYAKKEQERNARPKIKTKISNMDQYGLVFLGFPNWWGSMPMPVYTFVEENGLNGKTIAPFTTHGGGGAGHSVEDLQKIAPKAKILKPLVINGNRVQKAEQDVLKWLEGLGPALIETTTGNSAIYPDGGY